MLKLFQASFPTVRERITELRQNHREKSFCGLNQHTPLSKAWNGINKIFGKNNTQVSSNEFAAHGEQNWIMFLTIAFYFVRKRYSFIGNPNTYMILPNLCYRPWGEWNPLWYHYSSNTWIKLSNKRPDGLWGVHMIEDSNNILNS